MGEAYDRTGAFLGAVEADTAREVLDKLELRHMDAAEFRIKKFTEEAGQAAEGAAMSDPQPPAAASVDWSSVLAFLLGVILASAFEYFREY